MSAIIQQVDQADSMLANALAHPVIKQRLGEVGYTPAKIQEGITLLNGTRTQVSSQLDCQSQQKLTRQQLSTELKVVRTAFVEHRQIARMAFRQQPEVLASLGLDVAVNSNKAVWLDQAIRFYGAIATHTKVMQRYDVPKADLEQNQARLQSVKVLRQNNLQKKGQAQHATQQRDATVKELQTWLSRFRAAARLALADEPQLLEVLGIVVVA